jgi:hypothetical protein
MKAQLNLEAVYKTIANPAVLLKTHHLTEKAGRGSNWNSW